MKLEFDIFDNNLTLESESSIKDKFGNIKEFQIGDIEILEKVNFEITHYGFLGSTRIDLQLLEIGSEKYFLSTFGMFETTLTKFNYVSEGGLEFCEAFDKSFRIKVREFSYEDPECARHYCPRSIEKAETYYNLKKGY